MIITFTPYRVSLFGGGSDFPEYYLEHEHGGACLSLALDLGIYVIAKHRTDGRYRVGYTKTELVNNPSDLQHELIREAINVTSSPPCEIVTIGDLPGSSGLGSSSSVTVGVLHALFLLQGFHPTQKKLCSLANEIEIGRLGKPQGVQDAYAATYGGLQLYSWDFWGDNKEPVSNYQKLERNLMLFFTGKTREATTILQEQYSNIDRNTAVLDVMAEQAELAYTLLTDGKTSRVGALLAEAWENKKRLGNVTTPEIDQMYNTAIKASAIGGKICGAGGGGFLLLFVPPEQQMNVRMALSNYQEVRVRVGHGTKTIVNF